MKTFITLRAPNGKELKILPEIICALQATDVETPSGQRIGATLILTQFNQIVVKETIEQIEASWRRNRSRALKVRALSFWQPHASLIITGAKPFETRGRKTNARGDVLIHAAQRKVREELEEIFLRPDRMYRRGLAPLFPWAWNPEIRLALDFESQDHEVDRYTVGDFVGQLAFGAFIGVANIVACHACEEMTDAQRIESRGFGDFSDGRFAWELRDVRRLRTPIPANGHQGFFFAGIDLTGNELIPVRQYGRE